MGCARARLMPAGRLAALLALASTAARVALASPPVEAPASVVFVCEHGNAKSLIAAELFNRAAAARRSPLRAVARGVRPEAGIPAPVAAGLAGDGLAVAGFQAARMTRGEAAAARRIVAINLGPGDRRALGASAQAWSDIPAVSVDYAAARDALAQRVTLLLEELSRPAPRP